VRAGGNTSLPEQHFLSKLKKKSVLVVLKVVAGGSPGLSKVFLKLDRDQSSSFATTSCIVSTLQCRQDWPTRFFFGKRELIYQFKTNMKIFLCFVRSQSK